MRYYVSSKNVFDSLAAGYCFDLATGNRDYDARYVWCERYKSNLELTGNRCLILFAHIYEPHLKCLWKLDPVNNS